MIDTFKIDVFQHPHINASLITPEIFNDTKSKTLENKDLYANVECPYAIQAAIGGDIDIFKYLITIGASVTATGHIGLSKKNKNSVNSNIIGAVCHYGRSNLLEYILDKISPLPDINYKTSEKKSKNIKHGNLIKEYTDATPLLLTIMNENLNEDEIIDIIRILQTRKVDFTAVDYNKNNILHLAVRFNRFRVVKYIVEELGNFSYTNENNKEGQTPISLAQFLNLNNILEYLRNNTNENAQHIEEELLELIESTNSKPKKTKKNKKKKTEDNILLNSTEYQESFKAPKPRPVVEPKIEEINTEKTISSTQKEKSASKEKDVTKQNEEYDNYDNYNYDDSYASNQKTYERRSYYDDFNRGGYQRNYGSYGGSYKKDYNNNYYKNKNYYSKEDVDYNNYDNAKYEKATSYTNDNINQTQENKQESENILKGEKKNTEKEGIIGMNLKGKKNKPYPHNREGEYKESKAKSVENTALTQIKNPEQEEQPKQDEIQEEEYNDEEFLNEEDLYKPPQESTKETVEIVEPVIVEEQQIKEESKNEVASNETVVINIPSNSQQQENHPIYSSNHAEFKEILVI